MHYNGVFSRLIKSILTDVKTKRQICIQDGYCPDYPSLVTATWGSLHGSFKSATRVGAGTSAVVFPSGRDAIVLTDLMLTTDKVNGATATVNFTDGVNTVTLISANVTDAPCNIGIAFAGHWQGWQSAGINFVTTGVVNATLAIGYFRISEDKALSYSTWNARR